MLFIKDKKEEDDFEVRGKRDHESNGTGRLEEEECGGSGPEGDLTSKIGFMS